MFPTLDERCSKVIVSTLVGSAAMPRPVAFEAWPPDLAPSRVTGPLAQGGVSRRLDFDLFLGRHQEVLRQGMETALECTPSTNQDRVLAAALTVILGVWRELL